MGDPDPPASLMTIVYKASVTPKALPCTTVIHFFPVSNDLCFAHDHWGKTFGVGEVFFVRLYGGV
jgi:peroxiredoxin